MTNKERLISLLGFAPAEKDDVLDGALLDESISGAAQYSLTNMTAVKRAAVSVMKLILTTPDTTNENGYVINFDRRAVQKRIDDLENELGVSASTPTISSKSVW